MTSKEKAKELVSKYFNDAVGDTDYGWLRSIQCALIAVDEILEALTVHYEKEWFEEVKKEIEAL